MITCSSREWGSKRASVNQNHPEFGALLPSHFVRWQISSQNPSKYPYKFHAITRNAGENNSPGDEERSWRSSISHCETRRRTEAAPPQWLRKRRKVESRTQRRARARASRTLLLLRVSCVSGPTSRALERMPWNSKSREFALLCNMYRGIEWISSWMCAMRTVTLGMGV